MDTLEILSKPFDMEIHKKYFHNYLEVIIDEHGTVHYAVPSHQEWLINNACEKSSITREELYDRCPPEYYFDVIGWLTKITECIAVWNNYYKGKPNDQQCNKLKQLESNGLFIFYAFDDNA